MAEEKKKPRRGLLVDAWVGEKPAPSFESWLWTFKKRYRLDQPDFRHHRRSAPETEANVDPVAAYRFQRLTAKERVRFEPYLKQLAQLGYDLRTYEGVDRFWRLSQAERDRLYYVVQDPERFRDRVKDQFFAEFKHFFQDFQARFKEFFDHFQEAEPSFDPDDLAAHYRFLGLSPTATKAEVKERYRVLAFKHHPDHGGDETKMKALNIAYAATLRAAGEAGG